MGGCRAPSLLSGLLPRLLPALAALLVAAAARAEPPQARQAELLHLLKQDCGSCHGLTLKGGLGPPLSPASIAATDDAALVDAILNGRPRTPMPPWHFEITAEEARWLVARLREGVGQ